MNKKLTFEAANEQLEETLTKMENGNLTMHESVELYAKACELLGFCMTELETCRVRIEDINKKLESIQAEGGYPVEE